MAKAIELIKTHLIAILATAITAALAYVGKLWLSEVFLPMARQTLPEISNKALLALAVVQFFIILAFVVWVIILYRRLSKRNKPTVAGVSVSQRVDDGVRTLKGPSKQSFP